MHPIFASPRVVVKAEAGIHTPLPCFLLRGVLSQDECARAIQQAEEAGFQATGGDYPPSYRDNDRLIWDDAEWGLALFERLRPFLPDRYVDETGHTWHLRGLNPRFRYCRYRGGQSFCIHRDGAHTSGHTERSHLTCMVYLNDAQSFRGGATRYYAGRSAEAGLLGIVRPEAGTMVVFDHSLWHDGEAVFSGTKYVMRTDVLYAREAPSPADRADVLAAHDGYVWSALALRDGGLATASRDRTVRLWRQAGDTWSPAEVLTGHTASVVALAEDARGQLWSASRDRTVRRWEGHVPRLVGHHEGAALCLAPLPEGLMASGGADGHIRIWSEDGEHRGALHGHTGWVWALASIGDGLLASASEDGTIRIWHTDSGSDACPPAHVGVPVRALAALRSGGLVSGDSTGEVAQWQLTQVPGHALQRRTSRRVHSGAVCALTLLENDVLASGGEDDSIHIFRLADLRPIRSFRHAGFVRALAALPRGQLASASYDTTVRLWHWA
ncbi:MAG: 2OG-Fe(II) oxygenase [Myxococcaceae bacterium]|nr:2OG-Fe(II) oxygenase [Myxococcaceae bacterium]MCI0670500.1 2OG-Fe(II) oxygenase [Myxococcaceae bacterium]